ncbi:hypothetical protein [Desulforapulum autotrophicum]|nr:hypothetical protein [Desulforapulum autotrophicum]
MNRSIKGCKGCRDYGCSTNKKFLAQFNGLYNGGPRGIQKKPLVVVTVKN